MGSSGTPVTIYFAQSCPRLRVWARATSVGVREGRRGYVRSEQGYISGVLVIRRVSKVKLLQIDGIGK